MQIIQDQLNISWFDIKYPYNIDFSQSKNNKPCYIDPFYKYPTEEYNHVNVHDIYNELRLDFVNTVPCWAVHLY